MPVFGTPEFDALVRQAAGSTGTVSAGGVGTQSGAIFNSGNTTQPGINLAGLAIVQQAQRQQGRSQIESMYGDAQSAQAEAIRRARDTATSGLGQYERTAVQQAYKNRNQTDAAAAKNALRLKEIMASNGLLSSGDNLTANIQQNNERLSSLNSINQAETDTLQNIADKRKNIEDSAASQEIELARQISADKAKALMAYEQYQDQRALEMDRDAYNRHRDTINDENAKAQRDISNRIAEAGVTGIYNGSSTLQAKEAARRAGIEEASVTGMYNPYSAEQAQMQLNSRNWFNATPEERIRLAAENQSIAKKIGATQDAAGDWIYPSGMKTIQSRQLDSSENWKQKEWDWNTSPYNPDNIYKTASANNIGQSNQIARDRLNWEMNPNNPDNIYKSASAANVGKSPASKATATDYKEDPGYYDDVAELRKSPHIAVSTVEGNRNALIAAYGGQGYAAILKEAQAIQEKYEKSQE